MGIMTTIKRWIGLLFKQHAKDTFDVNDITSDAMHSSIQRWVNIYSGNPPWLSDDIRTINFARAVCTETARLATLAIGIAIEGSARAKWIQEQIDSIYFKIRAWVEYGSAYGTIILKPNGETVDIFTPDMFFVTDERNGDIWGVVFLDKEVEGDKYYTRMEYHRFVEFEDAENYAITNRCYVGDSEKDLGKPVSIDDTPWKGLLEEATIAGLERPLFGVLRMPQANSIDIDSPLGVPIFSDAIEEMRDLDIAYSRNATEIFDSKRTVLLDSDRLMPGGDRISNTTEGFRRERAKLELPDYIKNVYGTGIDDFYQEINPTLQTDARLVGINSLLSQIGYKCGYSNGYFVFNEAGGIVTATQIEADQQRTIQLIKDVRDKLESCLDGMIYALDAFADLYDLSPVGAYETTYDFGDITYSRNEERTRFYSYVVQGRYPFWKYLEKFEGIPEREAKELERMAQVSEPEGLEEE